MYYITTSLQTALMIGYIGELTCTLFGYEIPDKKANKNMSAG